MDMCAYNVYILQSWLFYLACGKQQQKTVNNNIFVLTAYEVSLFIREARIWCYTF